MITKLEDWYKYLNWENKPNFDTCHRHKDFKDFKNEYYTTNELEIMIENIFHQLDSETSYNVRFMGKKGSGKTTFLHYVKRNLIENQFSEKYFFTIVRTGKVALKDYNLSLKKLFVEHVFKKFYFHCQLEDEYNRIIENSKNDIEIALQDLQTLYFNDDGIRFKKRLITVLDDLDTLKEDQDIINIVSTFKRICGSGDKINKWVSIRELTFNNYSKKVQDEFTFFQHPLKLNVTCLYEIVKKRIYAKNNENAMNPFSKLICDDLSNLHDNSLRDSLGLLDNLLSNTRIPDKKQHQEFIQNWYIKKIPSILLNQGVIKNLHTKNFLKLFNYPIAYDMLMIIKYENDKDDVFALLDKIGNKRGDLINKAYIIPNNKKEKVLEILINSDLVIHTGTNLELSNSGKFISNMSSDNYINICEEFCKDNNDNTENEYWEVTKKSIIYKEEIKDRYLR